MKTKQGKPMKGLRAELYALEVGQSLHYPGMGNVRCRASLKASIYALNRLLPEPRRYHWNHKHCTLTRVPLDAPVRRYRIFPQ